MRATFENQRISAMTVFRKDEYLNRASTYDVIRTKEHTYDTKNSHARSSQ